MAMTQTPAMLRDAFIALPDNVRNWLASEKVLGIVVDINNRLDCVGGKVGIIPWLITRLAVKDLAPKYFMSELRDYLVVSEDEARAIAEELDKKILRPVELSLNRLDIDLNSLYLGQAQPAAAEELGSKKYEVRTEGIGAPRQFGVAADTASNIEPPASNIPEGPVILHTEREEATPTTQKKPEAAASISRPPFSINIPRSKYKKPMTAAPVTVRIETPGEGIGSKKYEVRGGKHEEGLAQESKKTTKQENKTEEPPKTTKAEPPHPAPAPIKIPTRDSAAKVVHYSDLRTPLDSH